MILNECPTTHSHVSHSTEHTGRHLENFIVSLVHGVGAILVVFNAIPHNDGASLRTCFDE